ncbi:ACT domain-containing protein [Tenacibaculum crassostreae]|uniref:ACT domain-containing protein n=1 Tax=Tenacibaculum crassostreae TaxID=502683 RepID=UPI003893209E
MSGEKNLSVLIKEMKPYLNEGDYVFVSSAILIDINIDQIIGIFKEQEGTSYILKKELADSLNLKYDFIASWITLKIHSSLDAVGLTASFSSELAKHNISCNVVAGFYHDHIFVAKKDSLKTIDVLTNLSNSI